MTQRPRTEQAVFVYLDAPGVAVAYAGYSQGDARGVHDPRPGAAYERSLEVVNRANFEAIPSFHAPDAVWDMSPWGMGTHEGTAAIRSLNEDWLAAYEEWEMEAEEILDLGCGVVFSVFHQSARPVGSTRLVRLRQATIVVWVEGVVVRLTMYPNIDEARADAERLAESRG